MSCSVVGLDGRLWLRLSAGIYNTKEDYKKVAVAVQRLQNREIAELEGVITGDGPLSCVVYRSESKGVYLYVENDDSLLTPGDKLASLLDLIEPLVSTGVTVDLVEDIADLFTKARAQRSCAYARRGRELPKWLGLNPNATFDLPDGRQCRGVLMPSICELPQGSAPGNSRRLLRAVTA